MEKFKGINSSQAESGDTSEELTDWERALVGDRYGDGARAKAVAEVAQADINRFRTVNEVPYDGTEPSNQQVEVGVPSERMRDMPA